MTPKRRSPISKAWTVMIGLQCGPPSATATCLRLNHSSRPAIRAREICISEPMRTIRLPHYPTDNSAKKKEAYQNGIDAFLHYARYLKPRLEVVRIPFEGKEIVGYLRLSDNPRPAPLVYLVTALDSRKEEWAVRNSLYLDQGISIFVTDMP